ncbi:Carboxylic ester hydrolase [Fusarium falciforme]|uniref:Carboxylic ester hydrolase n=1 Tax=Fusarium falciforme TaxID=195108 RepID=UPI00230134C5|nr:Carboxylic ester hydrolase [Fusarium falciforme]WAO91813.1 Carboxylic ester hydrolase [Fusarium falciforme]
MSPQFRPERAAVVRLRTSSIPSYIQTIVGKPSPISDDIEEFRGIPYAHVPGRWEHSRLRDRLPRDVFDATENGPRCPTQRKGNSQPFQSYLPYPNDREDEFECLNLLIVRPSKEALAKHNLDTETTQLPVLVWIHGGGFTDGAATDPVWDPGHIILRGLSKGTPFIAVSINYRLNIFGFGASSDMLAAQGSHASLKGVNFGLYDQKLALIWVKRSIAAFGGDDTKITIMGNSAGGISCHLHLLEAELGTKKPLFRRAGLMSGACGGLDLTSLEKADERWADLYRLWSVQAHNPIDRLNMLRRIPAKDLLSSVSELHWVLFMLVMDQLTIKESNLGCGVSVHLGQGGLDDQIKSADDNIQIMLSATDDEFRGFAHIANWDYPKFHSLVASSYPSEAAAEEVLEAYGILHTSSAKELFEAFSQFISDATMVHKVYRASEFFKAHRGKQALLHGNNPERVGVQYYHFEFGNPFSGPMQGIAHHGVELVYAFGTFHDALEKADQGILEGYIEPDQELAEVTVPEPPSNTEAAEYRKSNIDLGYELQDKLIQFVVEDCRETDQHANPDEITRFCHHRSVRMESWSSSEKWVAKRKKFELLDKDLDSLITATKRLVGSVIGMALW